MRRVLALLLAVGGACHQDVSERRVLTVTPLPSATVPASATDDDASAPTVEPIVITVMTPGMFEIDNTGGAPIKLRTLAQIRRPNAIVSYLLVEDCAGRETECVEIPAGGTLRPVQWTGFSCSSQCNVVCDKNVWLGDQTFDLTVTTCDGARAIASKWFPMPRDSRPGPFQRSGFVIDFATATVARLELPTQQFALGAPATPDHIAGFRVKPGTEKPIERALLENFMSLVVFKDGFDDKIAKRCLMSDLVGVRVVRHPRTTGSVQKDDVVEYAFDQTCSKFFAVRGDAAHRVEMATHYDPQRPLFLSWAKRALP